MGTTRQAWGKIVTFLALTAGMASVFYYLIITRGGIGAAGGRYTLGLVWTPGVAAIITRLIFQRNLRRTGFLLALCLLLLSGCRLFNTATIGEVRTETKVIELGSAGLARVEIRMPAGDLSLAGGAEGLAEATFHYNVEAWQPHVDYSVNGDQGLLLLEQPDERTPVGGKLVNDWQVVLNSAVPINLAIDTGAGAAGLDLRGLDLTELAVAIGAGTTSIDLSGSLDHDLRATIEGGVGTVSVKLPTDMGVQVTTETGIGGLTSAGLTKEGDYYVNQAFGEAPYTLFLDISTGVGGIELIAGNP